MRLVQLGGEPYPEPVAPPAPPGEESPVEAPQESPPLPPFDDTGRPTDTLLARGVPMRSASPPPIAAL